MFSFLEQPEHPCGVPLLTFFTRLLNDLKIDFILDADEWKLGVIYVG